MARSTSGRRIGGRAPAECAAIAIRRELRSTVNGQLRNPADGRAPANREGSQAPNGTQAPPNPKGNQQQLNQPNLPQDNQAPQARDRFLQTTGYPSNDNTFPPEQAGIGPGEASSLEGLASANLDGKYSLSGELPGLANSGDESQINSQSQFGENAISSRDFANLP